MRGVLISLVVGLLGGAALLYFCWARPRLSREPEVVIRTDTLTIRDTLTITEVKVVERRVTDTIRVVLRDTIEVSLPREQVVYEDSSYYAVVSGFQPVLDTLKVYPTTTTIWIEKTIVEPQKRWGLSVVGGGGFGVSGLTPFVGIGITYDLLQW